MELGKRGLWAFIPVVAALAGCAHYAVINQPPEVNLTQFPAVGMIRFSTNTARGGLPAYATQVFLQDLTEAQPGVRILEIGTLPEALASVGAQRLDAAAIRALGERANVQALFVGTVEVTRAAPSFAINPFAGGMAVSADVTATLSATLYDTAQGAVVWTRSHRSSASAGGGEVGGGNIGVDLGGEDQAYARIVRRAAFDITDPFRSHWIRQRVD